MSLCELTRSGSGTGFMTYQLDQDRALATISENAAPNPFGVFLQIINNCWDADAPRVSIAFGDGKITVEDNGHGMTTQTIRDQWFYKCHSNKADRRLSPGGRKLRGRYGAASTSIATIAGSYRLETWCDGTLTDLIDNVSSGINTSRQIDFSTYSVNPEAHGTKITMSELRIDVGRHFNIEQLANYLALSIPIGTEHGFEIEINGKGVCKRSMADARVFRFDRSGTRFGRAHGFLYLFLRKVDDAGVYVRVFGERQAEPDSILPKNRQNGALRFRLIADINADGLAPYCTLNHNGFQSCPAFDEFVDALEEGVRDVTMYLNGGHQRERRRHQNHARLYQQLRVEFCSTSLPEINRGTAISEDEGMDAHVVASYDSTANAVRINSSHPLVAEPASKPALYYALVYAVADAIAESRAEKDRQKSLKMHRSEVLIELSRRAGGRNCDGRPQIIPSFYYRDHELIAPSGLSGPAIRYYAAHGFLRSSASGILGKDMEEFIPLLDGLMPLPRFVESNLPCEENERRMGILQAALNVAGTTREPFVTCTHNQCYFIEPLAARQVAAIFQDIVGTGRWDELSKKFDALGNRFLSKAEIASDLEIGMDLFSQILDRHSTEIRVQDSRYSFSDLVRAYQAHRQTHPNQALH